MNFVNVHGRIGLESSIIWERWRWGRNRGLAVGRRKAFPSVAARKLRQFPRRVEAQLASQWRTMHCLLDDLFSIPLFPPVSDYRDGRFPVVIVSDDLFPGGEASGSPSLCTLAVTTVFAPLGTFHARRVIQTLVLECSGPAKACSPLSSFPFPLRRSPPSGSLFRQGWPCGCFLTRESCSISQPSSSILLSFPFFRSFCLFRFCSLLF